MPHIMPKKKKSSWEGDITGLLEVNVQGSCLIIIDDCREAFGFVRDVIGSTRRYTIVDKFVLIVLERITTPSFISLDMFHI